MNCARFKNVTLIVPKSSKSSIWVIFLYKSYIKNLKHEEVTLNAIKGRGYLV